MRTASPFICSLEHRRAPPRAHLAPPTHTHTPTAPYLIDTPCVVRVAHGAPQLERGHHALLKGFEVVVQSVVALLLLLLRCCCRLCALCGRGRRRRRIRVGHGVKQARSRGRCAHPSGAQRPHRTAPVLARRGPRRRARRHGALAPTLARARCGGGEGSREAAAGAAEVCAPSGWWATARWLEVISVGSEIKLICRRGSALSTNTSLPERRRVRAHAATSPPPARARCLRPSARPLPDEGPTRRQGAPGGASRQRPGAAGARPPLSPSPACCCARQSPCRASRAAR